MPFAAASMPCRYLPQVCDAVVKASNLASALCFRPTIACSILTLCNTHVAHASHSVLKQRASRWMHAITNLRKGNLARVPAKLVQQAQRHAVGPPKTHLHPPQGEVHSTCTFLIELCKLLSYEDEK